MFTVLISGSRQDPDLLTQERVKYSLGMLASLACPEGGLLCHGEANGIDTFASSFWASLGHEFLVKGYPYPINRGKAGGPYRNQQMVNDGADVALFFPVPESVGTYDCLRRARSSGILSFELTNKWAQLNTFQSYINDLSAKVA